MQHQYSDDIEKNIMLMTAGDYVIYSPTAYKLLGVDNGIGMWAGDGSDGKNEAFVLLDTFLLDTGLHQHSDKWKHLIIYPDLDTAKLVLLEIKDKLSKYFGITEWVVKKLDTYITLEDIDDNESTK
jgi:hypothetical protein